MLNEVAARSSEGDELIYSICERITTLTDQRVQRGIKRCIELHLDGKSTIQCMDHVQFDMWVYEPIRDFTSDPKEQEALFEKAHSAIASILKEKEQ